MWSEKPRARTADALDEAGRLVGATGRVLPATCEPVVLKAHVGREEVEGQVAVQNSGPIGSVSLVPAWTMVPSEEADDEVE